MRWRSLRRTGVVLLVLITVGAYNLLWAQNQRPASVNNVYSVWVKLSLIGYSQSEIESSLSTVDPELLNKVKHRLRLQVLNNLRHMNLDMEHRNSTAPQDIRLLTNKIRDEIRYAGLENDRRMKVLIRRQFGIARL